MCSRKFIFQTCVSFIHLTSVLVHGRVLFQNVDLFNMFKLMKDAGKLYLDNQISDPNVPHAIEQSKQYLVATILSEQEIRESKSWKSLDHINTPGRLKMYINEMKERCNLQIGSKPLHGEVMCLYLKEDGLDSMLETFKELHVDKMPIVVLYSHYIPCAFVKGIPYSCAGELGKEALANMDKYQMLVGFEEIFPGTNEDKAKEFMCQGHIGIYSLNAGVVKDLHYIPTGTSSETTTLFQELFTQCLLDTGIQKCCQKSVHEKCQHTCFGIDFLKMYADDLSYVCTKENENMRGTLTELSREVFAACAEAYVDDNIDPVCSGCRYPGAVTDWIRLCVVQSVGSANFIGTKTQSSWDRPAPNTPWKMLYREPRPRCTFPRSFCNKSVVPNCTIVNGMSRFEERNKQRLKLRAKSNFEAYKKAKMMLSRTSHKDKDIETHRSVQKVENT